MRTTAKLPFLIEKRRASLAALAGGPSTTLELELAPADRRAARELGRVPASARKRVRARRSISRRHRFP
jgi:hypothetical protein